MRRALLAVVVVLLSSISVPNASAQVLPEVILSCEQTDINIDVSPSGSRTATLDCTAENPTSFVEDVDLSVEVDIGNSYPSSITIPANSETEFTVTFAADANAQPANMELNITAEVTAVNGITWSWASADDEFSGNVHILPFQYLALDMNSMTRNLEADATDTVLVELTNQGNEAGEFNVFLNEEMILENAGFVWEQYSATVTIDPDETVTLSFNFTAPTPEEVTEFQIEFCGYAKSDATNEKCDSFKLNVEAAPKDALGTVGSVIGMDDETTMMMIIGGGGGLGLLLVMMVVLKVGKAKKRRIASLPAEDDFDDELDDFDDDFDELDDEELDFGDL
jgi:uncharacterized membrane protein